MSGLSVAYDSASLSLATGRYHIQNLRLSDPAQGGPPLLQIQDVHAKVRPWELLLEPEARISSVVLQGPTPLDFVYSANSLRLGERTKILVNAVRDAQPPGTPASSLLPFDHLDIRDVELTFTESEGILPGDTPPTATLVLQGDMQIENRAADELVFDFEGMAADAAVAESDRGTTGSVASGLKMSLVYGEEGGYSLSGSSESVALFELFREYPGSSLRAHDLHFDIASSSTESVSSYLANLQVKSLSTADPENDFSLTDEEVTVRLNVDLNTSTGVTRIREAALRSDGAVMRMAGEADFRGQETWYDLAVAGSDIDEEYRVILERFMPPGWSFSPEAGEFTFDVKIASRQGVMQNVDGLVQLRGMQVRTPVLPATLGNVFGDLRFSRDGIQFSDATADYGGARLAADGEFRGDPWQSRSGVLTMNWSAIVDVAELMRLHGGQVAQQQKLAATGRISGRGTWEQQVNLTDNGQAAVPVLEGGFELENVSLDHPMLPGAVSEVSGTAVVDDDRITVTNLTGKLRGNEMQVDGFMDGDQYFWRDPQVSASLTSLLDLTQLQGYLSNEQRAAVAPYELSGQAETRMLVSGPLDDLGSHITGVMRLSDVGLNPNLEFMEGRATGITGTVRWNGDQLTLDDLNGQINGEPVRIGGTIAADRLDLDIQSPASLETLQQTFPALGRVADMSGGLNTELTFSASTDNPLPTAGSLNDVLVHARDLLAESVKAQTLQMTGRLQLTDANIKLTAMPPARQERGRQIPAGRVTGLTGTININNDTLTVSSDSPLSGAFADTPNCRISGNLKLRPGNFPQMAVRITANNTLKLDTWVTGWGRDLDRPDKPPMTGKTFDLDVEIHAPQVELRGQRGGRSRGKIAFRMVQDDTPRVTEFREVVVQGAVPGTGHITGSGRIDSFYWNRQQFPRWRTSVDVQAMPLETMFSAVFVAPTNIRGLANGHLEMEGLGDNPQAIRGGGSVNVRNLELGGTAVIRQLGQTTGRDFGGRLFESAQAVTFQIGNGALSSRNIALQTNGLQLDMRGDYWFAANPARGIPARTIDGSLRLRLFKTVFGNLPIIGQVADLADEVTNAFLLAFRVTGPAANPRITPVPLPMFQGGS